MCFVFVAESKTLVKQHAFHMKRATVSNLKNYDSTRLALKTLVRFLSRGAVYTVD